MGEEKNPDLKSSQEKSPQVSTVEKTPYPVLQPVEKSSHSILGQKSP